MTWETVIGLEVHVQLATRSKLFCDCPTDFGADPNRHVCPVCLGLPGALPVPNREAVRLAVRAALAIGSTVHEESMFARKHYFYPDLPKGYQISQFDRPLATGGAVDIDGADPGRPVRLQRLHLEEDAGKSVHDRFPGFTAVDFNRCGVPLVEIVTEPDLRSPGEARGLLTALKQILEYVAVSDCNMEEGSLRVDANLSVRRPGEPLGTKQEVKNMNSFSAVERALEALRDLQVTTRDAGRPVEQATYSAATGTLRVMRRKEESHDYRYFPDPDLPPIQLGRAGIDVAGERRDLPELPAARRRRLADRYGLSAYDAAVLTGSRVLADYYESVLAAGADPKEAANWVMGPVLADAKEGSGAPRVPAERLAAVIGAVADGTLSQQAGKKVFAAIALRDEDPRQAAARLGLVQVRDDRLAGWVDQVVAANPDAVRRLRDGESKVAGFLMGEIMSASGGRADPREARRLLEERLG
jgi:aspartyl-tRNA(Asn)/glutamyl-tRNA(Gln) amidotransferase subunit B